MYGLEIITTIFMKKRKAKCKISPQLYYSSNLMLTVAESMRRMFDPTYQALSLLKNKDTLQYFIELCVAIELVNVCKGKNPSDDFVKAFRDIAPKDDMSNKRFLMHLATLIYLDPKNKLFHAIINHPHFPYCDAGKVITIAANAVRKEGRRSSIRDDKIERFEEMVESQDGSLYIKEKAFEPTEKFYKQIYQSEFVSNIRNKFNKNIRESNRKDRARNIIRYVDYIITSKEKKPNITKAAAYLKMSRKSLYQIKNILDKNILLKRLLIEFL